MRFRRHAGKNYRLHEIAPDEILVDSSNLPAYAREQMEGRFEQPIGDRAYALFAAVVTLAFLLLLGRAGYLEILRGAAYAAQSERNQLRETVLFADRGVITDENGVPLVTNVADATSTNAADNPQGFVSRVYAGALGLGNVLGYVSYPKKDANGNYYDTDIVGLAGVERSLNDTLAGKNGTLLTEKNALGVVISRGKVIPSVRGQSVRLSVDVRAQKALYDAVKETADATPFQAGVGILLDVNTGEVRALVSYPQYDPNVLSRGGPGDVIASYANDPRHVYLDRSVQGLFTPGSVVKPLEAAGALTDGIINPDYVINDTGSISVPNPYDPAHPSVFVDWKAIGMEDLRTAIAFSSDVYFYMIGGGWGSQKGLGIDRLNYWFRTFGLTSPTGIQLPGETYGFVPTPAWKSATYNEPWRIGDTYHTAIGQYAMQVTPIEMARAIAAVANGGKLVRPTLLANAPLEGQSIPVSEDALRIVREGMRKGVLEGTSVGLSDLWFTDVAGKTGTAQTGTQNQYHNAWAVGFFPYEHPAYAYVVVMEQGPAGNSTGGVFVVHQALMALHSAAPEYFR